MRIRSRITLYFGPFVLGIIAIFFGLQYYFVGQALLKNAHTELAKTEQNVHRSVQALLSTAINSYLRSITEQNINYITRQYRAYLQGDISELEAKELIQDHFNLQNVGDSGYLVAVEEKDEKLYLDLHPYLPQTECSETEGCQQWAKKRNGYTEYDWKNPTDNSYRKKAAFVQEFKPWNWIVGASSYRDEFIDLVDIDDLRKLISSIRINETGYFFVFDKNDTVIIHPELENVEGGVLVNNRGENIINLLKSIEDGYLTYHWKNPSEEREREKYAFIEILKDYDWYLVASGYFDEVYAPVEYLKKITLILALISGTVLLGLIYHLSKVISSPLRQLTNSVNRFDTGKREIVWDEQGIEEVNVLGQAFSLMSKELNTSILELQQTNTDLSLSREENQKSKLYYESIINSMPSRVIGIDSNFKITLCNDALEHSDELDTINVLDSFFFSTFKEFEGLRKPMTESLFKDQTATLEYVLQKNIQKPITYEITAFPLVPFLEKGAVIIIDDVTDRVEMEMRLRQSQKMDAVGQLAGGIAHDFNNMLSGILGSAELLRLRAGDKDTKLLDTIVKASNRAGELIQKLLAFARKENIDFSPIDCHSVIEDAVKILQHTIDKRIVIENNLNAKNSIVDGDWSLLENVILNIGINGGHAMKDGGTLYITTSNIFVNKASASDIPELIAGEYLQLIIKDTGFGIEQDTLKHIFEPFFTTKKQNEGTGLGLAAAYGAITQHKGTILVDSEIGRGTSFTILLPLSLETQEIKSYLPKEIIQGEGRILLIDDEQIVRDTTRLALEDFGYTVIMAKNGLEGIEIFKKEKEQIDLVILDMLMPKMNGRECFANLQQIDQDVKVIMSSGFTHDADFAEVKKSGLKGFIRKPHNMIELSEIVAKVIFGRKK